MKTVLLVEDDFEIRDILQDLLEAEGYDVIPAGNGRQALQFLAENRAAGPDLVILDIMMPMIDGRQVLEVMQRDQALAEIPVIVISAIARETPVGARALLKKPFSLEKLFRTVRIYTDEPPHPGEAGTIH
ncbi:MAG TPA: response regulator [Polyangia bacterium]|nr:response regulator [Polyangia bacterium]